MRSDIVPGNTFPDYQLPDHARTLRKFSELQGDDPLILTLARGNYCPKERNAGEPRERNIKTVGLPTKEASAQIEPVGKLLRYS